MASPALATDLMPEIRGRQTDFFAHAVEFRPLASLAAATETFLVDADADWLLTSVRAIMTDPTDATATEDSLPALISLESTGSGRLFQSRALHLSTLAGTAQRPGYLPRPKWVPRSSTVSVRVTSLDATDDWDLFLMFSGFKVFPQGR